MLEKAERILLLLKKQKKRELSIQEKKELEEWISQSEETRSVFREAADESLVYSSKEFKEYVDLYQELAENESSGKVVRMPSKRAAWFKWVAAASAIVFIAFAAYFVFIRKSKGTAELAKTTVQPSNDVAPGTYSAVLKLANGKEIILDSAGLGLLAQQGNANIINQGGNVKYEVKAKENHEIIWNTLQTNTGQSYSLTLSDGTKVWLNAKSSLKFPVAFSNTQREVEMEGEVYFEVAKNAKAPFKVRINKPAGEKALVEVLGTHFNINAYEDEAAIEATLVEGRVKVSANSNDDPSILTPGQQAVIKDNGYIQVRDDINLDVITAWKDQRFYFKSDDLKTMMRQLSRWYDIEVVYEAAPPQETFTGMVSRNTNLSEVLKMLKAANVPFRIEGKKLVIMAK